MEKLNEKPQDMYELRDIIPGRPMAIFSPGEEGETLRISEEQAEALLLAYDGRTALHGGSKSGTRYSGDFQNAEAILDREGADFLLCRTWFGGAEKYCLSVNSDETGVGLFRFFFG